MYKTSTMPEIRNIALFKENPIVNYQVLHCFDIYAPENLHLEGGCWERHYNSA